MKLSKKKWYMQIRESPYDSKDFIWVIWCETIEMKNYVQFKTESGCKRNFERFAKANGIKEFKYV